MSGLSLLDVAIAMVFLFLLLSLVCSAANEMIAALFQTRARFLEKGIYRLLETPEFAAQLYKHPLIKTLYDEVGPILGRFGRKPLPAYIPARTFALAVMDLVQPGSGTANALATVPAAPPTAAALFNALQSAPIPPSVKAALTSMIEAGGRDAVRARLSIEDWYNNTMDRVAGAYKRRTQYVLFAIGMVATLAVNADSVAVAKRLATSKTLAAAVAGAAQQFSDRLNAGDGGKSETVEAARHSLDDTLSALDKLGLPVGWTGSGQENTFNLPNESVLSASSRLLSIHWAGWLITALAISFGAPFWFDVLNRFMVVRSTVKPKEKSPDEASKG